MGVDGGTGEQGEVGWQLLQLTNSSLSLRRIRKLLDEVEIWGNEMESWRRSHQTLNQPACAWSDAASPRRYISRQATRSATARDRQASATFLPM